MQIHSISTWREQKPNGGKLPMYLVEVSHLELLALGAKTFEAGEHVTIVHLLERLESVSREVAALLKQTKNTLKG